ncbi:MAG: phage minor capsid protein, partial [Angelakisella sp.]
RTINYESGVHTGLEAAVRRNIMGGLGLMQEQISQYNHDQFGADGWEISAHAGSAPDHEPYQGRQYSDEAYNKLNNSLVRRIGTLNCGHAAFPVIMGVNEPQYSEPELQQFTTDNAQGISYQGRHYTRYEATQKQRQVERAMRKQKNRILVAEGADDKEALQISQIRLGRLKEEYVRFSRAVDLRTRNERAFVAGFGRKQAGQAASTIAKYSHVRYNKNGTIVATDDWKDKGKVSLPARFKPYAVLESVSQNGRQVDRMIYDTMGKQVTQINSGSHGNPKKHPYGEHGEHGHDILWQDGKIVSRMPRELTVEERKEHADIL